MSHLIEEYTNLIVLITNSISILFLVLLTALGRAKGNPFAMFLKGIFCNIILFLILLLMVILIYPDLAMVTILMLILQFVYFPISGIILLFISICIDLNWAKKNWRYMLLSFMILFGLFLLSIIYIIIPSGIN